MLQKPNLNSLPSLSGAANHYPRSVSQSNVQRVSDLLFIQTVCYITFIRKYQQRQTNEQSLAVEVKIPGKGK
jgi:hypothetical protein